MEFSKIFLALALIFSLISCSSDDDICVSGEATPRLKMKFKSLASGKLMTLDTLYVDADYGSGVKSVIAALPMADSVLVPLRVDDNSFTDIFIRTTAKGPKSQIRVNYTSSSQYVSPACGFKKTYKNLDAELVTPNPVQKIENSLTEISNENKTAVYLDF